MIDALMIDAEVFFNSVSAYNVSIFPMQIVTLVVAVILTYLLLVKPSTAVNKLIKIYLSFTFVWLVFMFPFEGVFKIVFGFIASCNSDTLFYRYIYGKN